MVFPVLLGEGKRLFPAGEAKRPLKLTESKTVGDGVSLLRFEPRS
jgi:dihydrofolate reductase